MVAKMMSRCWVVAVCACFLVICVTDVGAYSPRGEFFLIN